MYRSAWCEIDLAQLKVNLQHILSLARTRGLLVVKANAYGHGLVPVAKAALQAGIEVLGVATVGEAEQLRENGVLAPILIMCALDEEEIEWCVANSVDFLAWRLDHFQGAEKAAARYQRDPRIHVEIDTGMSRSGVDEWEFQALLTAIPDTARRSIVGLSTHFHSADLEDVASAELQLKTLTECAEISAQVGLHPVLHAANSPGTLRMPSSRLDMVRIGIAAYGLPPSEHTSLPPGLAPVLTWKASVTNLKQIRPGRGVGYGWRYVAEEEETVATLAIGYADGYRRSPFGANSVLIEQTEAPVVGSVFMDQCVIKVPARVRCGVGTVVTLLGRDGQRVLSAESLADRWQTNNYDVVSGIRQRVPRRYLDRA